MKFRNSLAGSTKTPVAAWLAAAALSVLPLSFAQTAVSEANDDVLELEPVVITGSLVPQLAGAVTASPVTVVSTDEIQATGVATSVLEIIRKSAPQFSGNANLGSSNANISSGSTGGGSQVSLRNAGTLVLINGRRAAFSPIAGTGGSQFVDVNQIPVAAIERIEILKDGASATYGTDATAGVVNIILKKNFEGVEIGGRYGMSDNEGNWEERSVSVAVGAGNEKTSITIAAEWTKTDPLWQYQREFSNPAFGTPSFAGVINIGNDYYVLNPSRNAPPTNTDTPIATLVSQGVYVGPFSVVDLAFGEGAAAQYAFNLADAVTVLLNNERQVATVNFEHKASEAVTIFGDLLYSGTSTTSQLNAQPLGTNSTFNAAADHPYNPTDTTVRVRNRFVSNPRVYNYDSTSIRVLGGAKGKITDDWTYEVAGNWNEVDQSYTNPGVLAASALLAASGLNPAVTTGTPLINLFAREQAPGAIAASNSIGTAYSDFTSRLWSVDAKVVGKLFTLPAGDVRAGFGTEYREETMKGSADLNSIPDADGNLGWAGATSVQPFSAGREITAAFAEIVIPVVKGLELTLAGRYEQYSDTDDPTVPKISVRYEAIEEELTFRASYGESFNAPTLYSMFGPTDFGFTDALELAPSANAAPVAWGQANSRGGANPDLQPSTSESYTLGVVYSPKGLKGFSVELDYWNISEDDIVGNIPVQDIAESVNLLGAASPYVDFLRFGSFEGTRATAPFQVINTIPDNVYITARAINLASQALDGFDFEIAYDFSVGDVDIGINSIWTYFASYEVQVLPTNAPEETAGMATALNGTIPEYRSYTTVNAKWKGLVGTMGISYIPETPYEGAPAGAQMDAYTTLDLSLSYTFDESVKLLKGLGVRVGVNNVTNEMPPLAPELFDESNADIATYDPIGRLFFIEAKYKF